MFTFFNCLMGFIITLLVLPPAHLFLLREIDNFVSYMYLSV